MHVKMLQVWIFLKLIIAVFMKSTEGQSNCNYNIVSKEGGIATPNFPYKYPNLKDCTWKFIAIQGHKIKLVFDYFDLEKDEKCAYDYVALYDGHFLNNTLLGRFCGSAIPSPVISTANKMLVVFHSDAHAEFTGFRATYKTGCFHKITSIEGFVSTPHYPENYPNDETCIWEFETTPGYRIRLSFDSFDLEKEDNCAYDNVALYDGLSVNNTLLGRFCGNKIPPSIISKTNKMLMIFRSDPYAEFKGFRASYKRECYCG